MAQTAVPSGQTHPIALRIPLREILPWGILALALSLVLLYFVGAEQGAVSMVNGNAIHEFMHDGRHLLGFPCH
ncbi:CbtB domain-containing protein [Microtetraspora malaysiensis]|uniref:CbtB domain-containing protein n=1 Tax=Microtetraspora malaysiensis TaxID=161358 RepID=UPI003D9343AF